MLIHIRLRDFAIVDELELEFGGGMTALTGETGAGKSILVDALGLALGDRGDSGVVRHGAERAEIEAGFDVSALPAVTDWLHDQDLDADGDCLLRRVLGKDGRSRAYINGRSVTLQALQELGAQLIDIHGQHEHQSLLRRDMQRALLDDYAGHDAQLDALANLYREWKRASDEVAQLRQAIEERAARGELLRYQVRELQALALTEDELDTLNQEHARLANVGRLLETSQRALNQLYESEEGTAHLQLSQSLHEIEVLCDLDPSLNDAKELLAGALIQLREGADALRRYTDRLELDPERLNQVEQRLGSIHDMARKHRLTPSELPVLLIRLEVELAGLENADARLDALQAHIDALTRAFNTQAQSLSDARRRAAQTLGTRVSKIMTQLGMPGGRIEITVEASTPVRFTPTGIDAIEFLVSANPGQPLRPLSKVASGGELSRISLAIQVITANSGRIPTLIFDEVDTGIGGGVAEVVGRQLRTLGEARQVLCVTHLPQVAAQAHHHLQVSKLSGKDHTRTSIRVLNTEQRTDELARMLGGVEITSQTLAHAEEMLTRAQQEPVNATKGKPRGSRGGKKS